MGVEARPRQDIHQLWSQGVACVRVCLFVCLFVCFLIAVCRTTDGTFDEDGYGLVVCGCYEQADTKHETNRLKMSDKGMADGEQLYQLHDFEKIRHLGSGAQGNEFCLPPFCVRV